MDERIRVQVIAVDPVVRAGVGDMVRGGADLTVVADRPDVVLIVADQVDDPVLFLVRSLSGNGRRVLLVTGTVTESDVLAAVEAGAGGLRRRAQARPDRSSARRLTEREKAVLLMLADGHETEEIARSLAYSVRTVTGIVHTITHRWQVRNRAHAVAYALREGLI